MNVAVGRDSRDLRNLLAGSDGLGVRSEVFHDLVHRGLSTATEVHWVAAGRDVLDTLGINGTGENGRGGGTVTSNFVCLLCDVLNKAGTKVLELVLQGDSLGNSDTV